jgi:hypothetical protein
VGCFFVDYHPTQEVHAAGARGSPRACFPVEGEWYGGLRSPRTLPIMPLPPFGASVPKLIACGPLYSHFSESYSFQKLKAPLL